MQKAYRFRLYPTDEQGQQMTRIIGCCRFVWNRLLEYSSKSYERRKESHTAFDLNNFIAHSLKPAFPWLSDAPAQTLQCVSADLSAAFKAFFRKDAAYPKFKTKHRSKKSFRIPQRGKVDVNNSRIYVQGIGWVEAVIHRKPIGKLKNITVTVNPSGTVYASCLFDDGLEAPVPELPEKPKVIGIDLNLERLAVCSDGREYENPRTLKQYEKRLRHLQKLLSKKKKGSGNWKKLKTEIAVLHEKISNTRKDSIHKMTKKIVCDSQAEVIVIEDLNVAGMMKNRKLSKHIQDASFFEIRRQFDYKSLFYGKTLMTADRFFASSRTCHICGWHNAELTLSDREWECRVCHTRQDRDRNAALNLESFGLKALAGDAGEVKPLEMPTVDGRAEMHLRSMASVNEEKKTWILHGSLQTCLNGTVTEKNVFEKGYAKVLFPLLNGKEIGFALFFLNYSTWLGKPGLYIEDLYIRPEYRHRGYGKRTMKELSRIALENGCGRLEWWCQDENTPAVAFYEEGLKAEAMRDWTTFRLEKDSIKNLLET